MDRTRRERTRRGWVAGIGAGTAAWLALVVSLRAGTGESPSEGLLKLLSTDSGLITWAPLVLVGAVAAAHASVCRRSGAERAPWHHAAWSVGCLALGLLAWTWAIHYAPFTNPLAGGRRVAALGGLAAFSLGIAVPLVATLSAYHESIAAWWRDHRPELLAEYHATLRDWWEDRRAAATGPRGRAGRWLRTHSGATPRPPREWM
ncbi:MAG TPA: hypothetical protein VFK09_08630 [Gemmatimonadales bacterium]|nr:hypothetical protein [Gemmatimonadales bacterium]